MAVYMIHGEQVTAHAAAPTGAAAFPGRELGCDAPSPEGPVSVASTTTGPAAVAGLPAPGPAAARAGADASDAGPFPGRCN